MNDVASPELAARIKAPAAIEKLRIASRDQWLGLRQRDVTASVAAALLGIHPYMTAFQLWALKTGQISEDAEETPPMRRGRLLEPVAVQCLREDRPDWQISDHPVGLYFRDPAARIGATPDLLAKDERGRWGVVQLKSVDPMIFRRDWHNADGSVEPPLWITIQAIIEAHLTGFEWAAVAPMVVGHGVELPVVPVPLHEGIIERIKGEVAHFWRLVDEGRAPDPDYGRDGALLAQLHAGDARVLDLTADNELPDLIAQRETLSADRKQTEIRWDENRARILAKMQGAGAGRMADGRIITAKKIDIAAHQRAASSRVDIRIKKGAAA